ncbi:MAG: glycosyltransferase [Planctomycetes bacterium]|nr:glycosyltransferase [Planctomycetota bacterium]
MDESAKIAVMIPCHNESAAIAKVIDDFRAQLPSASVYVFDNCCTDDTAKIAKAHGAIVIKEPRQGKGYVVESMFARVHADYYVMVDGDDTYPASKVGELLAPVVSGDADMVVGARLADYGNQSFRPLHVAGNNLVRGLINWIFGSKLTDILSGYRAFNRKVAKTVPVISAGFEVETELTVQMLYYRLRLLEVQVPYGVRPVGSVSKLRTFRDGSRVLWKLFNLFRAFKPLTFFGGIGLSLLILGFIAGLPPVFGFIDSGYTEVRRFPLAILAVGLVLLGAACGFLGVQLHAMNWRLKELHSVITRDDD